MSEVNNVLTLVLNAFAIKTPQLIGIIAGCVVFVITIGTVFYLLYASGSLKKLAEDSFCLVPSNEPFTFFFIILFITTG